MLLELERERERVERGKNIPIRSIQRNHRIKRLERRSVRDEMGSIAQEHDTGKCVPEEEFKDTREDK